MTKQLQDAITEAARLAEPDQTDLAEMIRAFIAARTAEPVTLTQEEEAAIDEGLAQADRGEFIPDDPANALLRRSWA